MEIEEIIESLRVPIEKVKQELDLGYCSKESISLLLGLLDSFIARELEELLFTLQIYRENLMQFIDKLDSHKFFVKKITQYDDISELEMVNIIRQIYELEFKFHQKDILFLCDDDIIINKKKELKLNGVAVQDNGNVFAFEDENYDDLVDYSFEKEGENEEDEEERERIEFLKYLFET